MLPVITATDDKKTGITDSYIERSPLTVPWHIFNVSKKAFVRIIIRLTIMTILEVSYVFMLPWDERILNMPENTASRTILINVVLYVLISVSCFIMMLLM